jgi:tripartite-type tricarboxylate transporter receptor subunit TctC
MRRLSLAALLLAPALAWAQAYPSQPIRIIVPFPAGGGGDTIARPIAQHMSESMGQPVIVDNRAGASAMIGSELVARAAPDGYTLLLTFDPPHNTTPYVAPKVPYDTVKDFTPITMVVKAPQTLVVNAAVPAQSLKEFIDYVKKNPGKVFYGTAGKGTAQHFGGELLNQTAGIEMVHVAYKGTPPVITDLLAGRIQASISVLSNVKAHVQAGKLRALAVLESTRASAAPELPTVAEAGVPNFRMPITWIGLLGPANLPRPIVSRIHSEAVKAANKPTVRSHFEKLGFDLILNTPEEMSEVIARSVQTYKQIATKANIHPD